MAIDFAEVSGTARELRETLGRITRLSDRIESNSVDGVALDASTRTLLMTKATTLNAEYNANRDAFETAKTP